MIRLEIKKYHVVLTERGQKHQHYYQIDKYKYLTGERILPSDQNRMTES